MVSKEYKKLADEVVKMAKERNLIRTYKEFCEDERKQMMKKEKYNLYKSLEQSLKEVKLIKEGKIKPKTWDEVLNELRERSSKMEDEEIVLTEEMEKELSNGKGEE